MHERRARLQPGADWLRAERERRSWSQRELAERITGAGFPVKQDRISVYENAQDEPRPEFREDYGRALSRVFGVNEVDVYKGLRWPMPSDEALDDYYEEKYKAVFEGVERRTGVKVTKSGGKHRRAGVRRNPVTRKGDSPDQASQERASGI